MMPAFSVEICRYVDEAQPGWVECRLIDAQGNEHIFVEKIPVVSRAALGATTDYPQHGLIACVVIGRRTRADGGEIVEVETATPWGVMSVAGSERFEIFPAQFHPFCPGP